MTVSLHLCDEQLVFGSDVEGTVEASRVLDVKKLNADGVQSFAVANTGTDDFAAGALAMLELLEATLGRPLNVCADSDPVASASSQRPAQPAPTP